MFDMSLADWAAVLSFLAFCIGLTWKFILDCRRQAFSPSITSVPIDKNHHPGTPGTVSEVGQYIVELTIESSPTGRFNDEYWVFVYAGRASDFEYESNEGKWTADRITGANFRQTLPTYTISPQSSSKTVVLDADDRQYKLFAVQSTRFSLCSSYVHSRLFVAPLCAGLIPNILLTKVFTVPPTQSSKPTNSKTT